MRKSYLCCIAPSRVDRETINASDSMFLLFNFQGIFAKVIVLHAVLEKERSIRSS